jgi:hypothetical protein
VATSVSFLLKPLIRIRCANADRSAEQGVMHAFLFFALPIAVWALVLLGYAFVRAHRDRIERRNPRNEATGSM